MNYNFKWDKSKEKGNERKHEIAFERAATVFKDPHALTIFDHDHSENEDRWITLGMDLNGVLIMVCHTFFDESKNNVNIRIYSARKATKREKTQYEVK